MIVGFLVSSSSSFFPQVRGEPQRSAGGTCSLLRTVVSFTRSTLAWCATDGNVFAFCDAFRTARAIGSVKGKITTGATGDFKKPRSASIVWGPSFILV